MIQSKGNEVWTTTPDTHRLMFKAEEGTEHPTYFTRCLNVWFYSFHYSLAALVQVWREFF